MDLLLGIIADVLVEVVLCLVDGRLGILVRIRSIAIGQQGTIEIIGIATDTILIGKDRIKIGNVAVVQLVE